MNKKSMITGKREQIATIKDESHFFWNEYKDEKFNSLFLVFLTKQLLLFLGVRIFMSY
jgi:hypothetical protein